MGLIQLIKANYEWLFSGIGVFILSIIIGLKRRGKRRGKRSKDGSYINIITKGKNSPGIVKGNYTIMEINKNDQKN